MAAVTAVTQRRCNKNGHLTLAVCKKKKMSLELYTAIIFDVTKLSFLKHSLDFSNGDNLMNERFFFFFFFLCAELKLVDEIF